VHGKDKCKLFDLMVRATCLKWRPSVEDGMKTFPKLPVYLCTHHATLARSITCTKP
jgi:hypothetical protein